jgi:hypothetical protein
MLNDVVSVAVNFKFLQPIAGNIQHKQILYLGSFDEFVPNKLKGPQI